MSAILPNVTVMFTAYAIDLNSQQDTQVPAETLQEALTHLRELVTTEIQDPNGPRFDRYGVTIDKEALACQRNDRLSSDPFDNAQWLSKKANIDPAVVLGALASMLEDDFGNLVTTAKTEWSAKHGSDGEDHAAYARRCRQFRQRRQGKVRAEQVD